MPSIINATVTSGLTANSDVSGNLIFQTSSNNVLTLDSSQNATFAGSVSAPNTFGFKNRIINGNMGIWQRGNTTTAATNTVGYYNVDRFLLNMGNSTNGKVTLAQSTDTPTGQGFPYSLLVTCSNTESSIGSTQYSTIVQVIESQNISDVAYGTNQAKTITLSYWIKMNITGTFPAVMVQRPASTQRAFPWVVNYATANTWQKVVVTVPGDIAGTLPFSNVAGLEIDFCYLAAGSNYQNGTANTWNVNSGANQYMPSGYTYTNFLSTIGNTFQITGVQLETGSQATPFDFRDITRELQLCQRYYYRTDGNSTGGAILMVGSYAYSTSNAAQSMCTFPVTMRAAPTSTFGGSVSLQQPAGNWPITRITNSPNSTTQGAVSFGIGTASLTVGAVTQVFVSTVGPGYVDFSAEL